jgi:hypothetical protein
LKESEIKNEKDQMKDETEKLAVREKEIKKRKEQLER